MLEEETSINSDESDEFPEKTFRSRLNGGVYLKLVDSEVRTQYPKTVSRATMTGSMREYSSLNKWMDDWRVRPHFSLSFRFSTLSSGFFYSACCLRKFGVPLDRVK